MKRVLVFLAAVPLLIIILWYFGVPDASLPAIIENSLQTGLKLQAEGLKKGLLLNFRADSLRFMRPDGTLLAEFKDFRAGFSPADLLKLSLGFDISASAGSGTVAGKLSSTLSGRKAELEFGKVDIAGVPFFELNGLGGAGLLTGSLRLDNEAGEVRFSVEEAKLKTLDFKGLEAFPASIFKGLKGLIAFEGSTLNIKSFTAEGKGIYAKIKGSISAGNFDMVLELMPEQASCEICPVLLPLLESNRVSPGYYRIAFKKTAAPAGSDSTPGK